MQGMVINGMKVCVNFLCLLLTVVLFASAALPAYAEHENPATDITDQDTTEEEIPETDSTAPVSPTPNTTAPIAVVMDYYTGEILFEKNMEQRWIPASMTKSMTAFIVYQEIAAGNLSFDTKILVSAEASRFSTNRSVPGSYVPLPSGQLIDVDTLLKLLMIPSGNAVGVVFAEHISGSEAAFVERMNETAASLGMYAEFTNSHGAYVHFSNAYSTAILVREFITRFPDILRITSMRSVYFRGRTYRNTNLLISQNMFPEADGFKTGSLRQAGWNHSTTAMRDGRRIIAVVMNTSSRMARQTQSRLLLNFGFDELERREKERIEKVRVFYNGGLIPLPSLPEIYKGRLMLPAADVLEYLGYTMQWHQEHKLVSIAHENSAPATFFEDRDVAVINGNTISLMIPVKEINNCVYISLQSVGLLTDTAAEWNKETGVVRFR